MRGYFTINTVDSLEEIFEAAVSDILKESVEDKVEDEERIYDSVPSTDLFDDKGFIFADSNKRLLSRREVENKAINETLSEKQSLQFMINEMYARYGAFFVNPFNQSHYDQYSWYRSLEKYPLESLTPQLNSYEVANMDLFVLISKEKGYR